jgi:hypothetical protein
MDNVLAEILKRITAIENKQNEIVDMQENIEDSISLLHESVSNLSLPGSDYSIEQREDF